MSKRKQPYSDDKIHVMESQCDTCVFKAGNLMRLEDGRLKDLVKQNLKRDAALICHKTIYDEGYVQKAVCRGYFDAYSAEVTGLRMAIALEMVQETDGKS